MTRTASTIASGFAFPEGPRWHEDRLWFSDQHDSFVYAMDTDGKTEQIVAVPQQPSGLGWLPDGRLLVVSMIDRRLMRLDADALTLHADLSALAPSQCNDMVVDGVGRAYVGNFGFDIYTGEEPRDTCIIAVEPDGRASIAAEGVAFPNGSAITPDGRTLLVGESMGQRISAFDIADDGTLSNQHEWAKLRSHTVDGMCLDADGAIWAACPYTGRVVRVREGGEVLDEVSGTHAHAYACMLGGSDRRTLYICTASSHVPAETRATRDGRIDALTVDVPGAGLP